MGGGETLRERWGGREVRVRRRKGERERGGKGREGA